MAKQGKGGPQKAGAKSGATGGSSRSGQATTTQTTKTVSPSKTSGKTATPAPAATDSSGLNRQARKDEARRQREAIRRKMARQRIMRRVLIIGSVVLVLALVVFLFVRPSGLSAEEQQLLADAPAAAQTAGCAAVETVAPYSPSNLDRTHIGDQSVPSNPPLSTYPSQPPASGPHSPNPMPAGVYPSPPDVYRTIHSLEHGAVIIWYAPSAAGDPELAKIQDFFRQSGEQDHVIVAPYNYPDQGEAGQLPEGTSMMMVSWHHSQSCDQLSLPVAFAFAHDYKTPTSLTGSVPSNYKGDAPEPGLSI